VSGVSHRIDRVEATFDNPNLVPNAGLVLAGTLMVRLGLEALVNTWVRTGSALPGRKVLTLVSAMLAGASHIDHVDILRAGATAEVLPHRVMAPSTIGTFLRTFTFGHVRQLDAVLSRALGRAWNLGAGLSSGEAIIVDLDSTICEVYGKQKQGASYGYTKKLGYHPLLATLAGTGEIVMSRMRKGSANTARGAVRFVNELLAVIRHAGADGSLTVRADSGFWSWKLVDRLNTHGVKWSITVRNIPAVHAAISRIPDTAWVEIGYTDSGKAQVASTTYTSGRGPKQRVVRLVVRRTRLTDPAQRALWPDWRHHCFITNIADDVVTIDAFHRRHATVELAIKDLKEGAGLEHVPSGHYHANAAWLSCVVLAHNLSTWVHTLSNQHTPITNRTRRRRFFGLCATLVNKSGQMTLRFPLDWPWENEFSIALTALRALPQRSG